MQTSIQNIDILKNSAAQGIATAPVDIDNLVRRIPLLLQTPDGFVSAFGTEVLKTLTGGKTYIIKSTTAGISIKPDNTHNRRPIKFITGSNFIIVPIK